MKTQELKNTLHTIAKHITSLVQAADMRARGGESPVPTARGGLGIILTTKQITKPTASSTSTGSTPSTRPADSPDSKTPQSCDASKDGGREGHRFLVPSPVLFTTDGKTVAAAADDSNTTAATTMAVTARTRVLRRVSSVRRLLLGDGKYGDRLAHFAQQMGLPHDDVVRLFQVTCCARKLAPVNLTAFYYVYSNNT